MLSDDHLCVNAKNHLTIGGKDALELAAEFGTPLYVIDEAYIRAACTKDSEHTLLTPL